MTLSGTKCIFVRKVSMCLSHMLSKDKLGLNYFILVLRCSLLYYSKISKKKDAYIALAWCFPGLALMQTVQYLHQTPNIRSLIMLDLPPKYYRQNSKSQNYEILLMVRTVSSMWRWHYLQCDVAYR